MKKHNHPRTEEDGDGISRKKRPKKKKNNSETEADSSSSSDHSSFVALVTASNLHEDALYLPKDFSCSSGLQRECCKIVLTNGGERAWALDLSFNKSSDTFYISRGWRNFCDENCKEAGALFVFRLVGKGEMPLLSFCPTKSKGEKPSEKESLPVETNMCKAGYISTKKHQHPRTEEAAGDDDQEDMELSRKKKAKKNNSETEADSSSSDHSCFVALVTASNLHEDALYLPKDFSSSNGLQRKCREIVLTDGGERSWALDLRFNKSFDTFYISRGWRSFCDENRKEAGALFVFKLVGKGEMPFLSFCPTERRGEKASEKESLSVEPSSGNKRSKKEMKKNNLRCREPTPPSESRFVTLTLTRDSLRKSRQRLPLAFMRENGMEKPGIITLLGKDGTKRLASLLWERTKQISLGMGWRNFATANGLKTGESFTLESIWENGTPMLSLVSTYSTPSIRQQGEYCSKASAKEHVSAEPNSGNNTMRAENSREEMRESSSAIENRFVTLTLTHEDVRDCILILPSQFMKANGINRLGKIIFLGKKHRTKWFAYLLSKDGIVALGYGWKGFCEANGVKTGESFTLEFLDEQNTTPVFEFCPQVFL